MKDKDDMQTEPKPLSELQIDNDFIFMLVMQNKEICRRLSEILLGVEIKEIAYNETQKSQRPFYLSKSVRFDAYLKGSDKIIRIEMQSLHYEHLPLRARYYQSVTDVSILKTGEEYADLKDTYLLFICKTDPFGKTLPVYTIRNRCDEDLALDVSDGTIKKFFNCSAYNDVADTELKSFLEYVSTYKATNDWTSQLDEFIKTEKTKEENVMKYSDFNMVAMDARREGRQEGIQQGYEKAAAEIASLKAQLAAVQANR